MSPRRSPHSASKPKRLVSKQLEAGPAVTGIGGVAATTAAHAGASGCSAAILEGAQQTLAPTCWLDGEDHTRADEVSIRFTGSRAGVTGKPQPGERFVHVETFEGIGSGPASLTATVHGVHAGEWTVKAERVVTHKGAVRVVESLPVSHQAGISDLKRTLLQWGSPAMLPEASGRMKTCQAPFAAAAGTSPFAWPAFVATGFVVALVLQAVLVARAHLPAIEGLALSLIAILFGSIGAKVWYVVLQRRLRGFMEGMCIQGFLLGATGSLAISLALAHIPPGAFLDAAAPGLFLGMVVGRLGCFFSGCCSGRPTSTRRGIWSSNRRVGTRRVPTQLLESGACLFLGGGALLLVLRSGSEIGGAIFVGATAGYVLVRQVLLLPLRMEPRKTSVGRWVTMAIASAVLIGDILVSTLR